MLMMMRADENANIVEGCTAEELLACIAGDNYDECVASCGQEPEEELPGFVTVKGNAASTQEVAMNAVNKKVGTITLKAGENDTTVSSVVIAHSGLGDASAVSAQLFNNGVAVTSQKTISKSSQQVTLKLSPAIVMKANSSMTFDVVASLSGQSNETHNFSVAAVNVANGKAEGTPVSLGTLKTTSYVAGNVTAALSNGGSLKAGENDKSIVTVKVTPSKKGTINSITLTKKSGTEDLDELVSNVKAYYNDEVIGSVKVTDEKIVISDLKIDRNAGQSATIELRGDCVYVGSSVNTTLWVELNDVIAVESNTDENMGNAESNQVSFSISGADLTLKKMTDGEQTVVPGSTDVELLNVKITSKSELEVNDYTISFTNPNTTPFDLGTCSTGSSTTLSSCTADTGVFTPNFVDNLVTVYVDGEDYEMTTGKSLRLQGNKSSFTVNENNPVTIRVVANFNEDATAANYKMSLTLSGAKTTNGNDTITLNSLSKAGDTTKLQAAGATVKSATKAAPVTSSLFANKEQEIGRFAIKATSDKITLKKLSLNFSGDDKATSGELTELLNSNLKLVDVDTDKEIPATFDEMSGGKVMVRDISYDIEKDATANIKVIADINSISDGDTNVMNGKVTMVVEGYSYKTSTTSIKDEITNVAAKDYTFRPTAPSITLEKASDNMFKVTIENEDEYDTGIVYSGLVYRVRTDTANVDFSGRVCLVNDVNVISCNDTTSSGAFGTNVTAWTDKTGSLAENDEVSYYILIDGTTIEPSILRAEISSLSYNVNDGVSELFAERYNISKLLNE